MGIQEYKNIRIQEYDNIREGKNGQDLSVIKPFLNKISSKLITAYWWRR